MTASPGGLSVVATLGPDSGQHRHGGEVAGSPRGILTLRRGDCRFLVALFGVFAIPSHDASLVASCDAKRSGVVLWDVKPPQTDDRQDDAWSNVLRCGSSVPTIDGC